MAKKRKPKLPPELAADKHVLNLILRTRKGGKHKWKKKKDRQEDELW